MAAPRRLMAISGAALAVVAFAAGLTLAAHHPVAPVVALALFYLWCAVLVWQPACWLFVLPAALPVLNFSPWTGWLAFEELDFLLLGIVAAGYGSRGWRSWRHGLAAPAAARAGNALAWLAPLLAGAGLLALGRGLDDAPAQGFDWFAGYTDALNSLRVAKSLAYALLLLPLTQQLLERWTLHRLGQLFARGMVTGLLVVTLAAFWERLAFPGLLDFAKPYRTTALFWEMHVGGAAFDAYLAMAAPFVVWALRSAAGPWRWTFGAVLALLVGYACLTSFSRGVYVSVLLPLLVLAALLWAQRRGFDPAALLRQVWQRWQFAGWRPKAVVALLLALGLEALLVLGTGSFMLERMNRADKDFNSRVRHWNRGLDLLTSPQKWWLGLGAGRLPAHYGGKDGPGEFSGAIAWVPGEGPAAATVRISGPASVESLGGLYTLSQRVDLEPGQRFRAEFDVRVAVDADVQLEVCERHLLYDGRCQVGYARLRPLPQGWQHVVLQLQGPVFRARPWYAPRLALYSLSVANAGATAEFRHLSLRASNDRELLRNRDFARGLASWIPATQFYFLPWHIDNLYLEVLIERGWLGLLLLLALLQCALWTLVLGAARHQALAPYLAASLLGVTLVGMISSVMDVPRIAFLFQWLALFALLGGRHADRNTIAVTPGSTSGPVSQH